MEVTDQDLSSLATRMLADYDEAAPGSVFGEGLRLTLPDAWRLQTAVTKLREARGEKVIGYKVGCVDPGNQRAMGLSNPVWGRLWDTELYEDGVSLKKSDFANIAIEAEFAIVLSKDLDPDMPIDKVAASVDSVHPVLELHNLVMRSDPPHGHELVANNCINCGVVRGAPITDLTAPRQTDLKLIYDQVTVDDWTSLRWPDDILGAVSGLTKMLAGHGLALRAGDLVLTSAWGPPIPVDEHTRVDVTTSHFGSVSANFT